MPRPLCALAAAITILALDARGTAAAANDGVATVDRAAAKKHLEAGRRLLDAKKPAEALPELVAAAKLDPQPRTLKLMADAYARLERRVEAHATYERALGAPGEPLSYADREEARKAARDLAGKTATIRVDCDEEEASIELDGEPLGPPPLARPIRVETGAHVLRVKKAGFVTFEATFKVTGGEERAVAAKLVAEPSVGTIVVRSARGEAADVYLEGELVGAAPATVSAGPGRYAIALGAAGRRGDPQVAEVTIGATIDLTLEPPAATPKPKAVKAADEAPTCEGDDDCEDGLRCVRGGCQRPKRRRPPPADSAEAAEGESCVTKACGPGLSCSEDVCKKPEDVPRVLTSSIGAYWQVSPGLVGDVRYPVPMHALAMRVEVPFSRWVRWHLAVGYANLSATAGFKLMPFGLSVPVPIWRDGRAELWVEPGVDLVDYMGFLSGTGHDFVLGSTLWVRASLHLGSFFVAAEPIGLEIPFLRMSGNAETTAVFAESSGNYVFRLGLGAHF